MKLIWYFDFISPFAYLQLHRFKDLPSNVEIEYKPVLLAGLLNHWQNVGPAEIPPKRLFTYQHCYWLALKNAIPFKMPPAHPFNSLKALRLAIATGNQANNISKIFDVIWQQGLDLNTSEADEALQQVLNIENVNNLISQASVKQQLKENTLQAAEHQIFGVPTFQDSANAQARFWGLDAFDMLLDYINNPTSFYDINMQQFISLPHGAQRQK